MPIAGACGLAVVCISEHGVTTSSWCCKCTWGHMPVAGKCGKARLVQ